MDPSESEMRCLVGLAANSLIGWWVTVTLDPQISTLLYNGMP